MKRLIPTVVVALLLAGCSSPAPAPSPTTPPGPVEYGAVSELKDAFITAGGECGTWEQTNQVRLAAQSGTCGPKSVLSTYSTKADLDEMVSTLKAFSPDGYSLLIGPNWAINSPQVESIYKKLGGTLATK